GGGAAEAFGGARLRLGGLDGAIAERRRRDQRVDEAPRDGRDLFDAVVEHLLVQLRRRVHAGELPHELQRRRADLLVSRRRLKIEKGLDAAAHENRLAHFVTAAATSGYRNVTTRSGSCMTAGPTARRGGVGSGLAP